MTSQHNTRQFWLVATFFCFASGGRRCERWFTLSWIQTIHLNSNAFAGWNGMTSLFLCFYFLLWQSQALAHLKGTKHAKKLKALDAPKSKPKGSGATTDSADPEITKGLTSSRVMNCSERTGLCFSFPDFPSFLLLLPFRFEKWISEPPKTPFWNVSGISPRRRSLRGWMTHWLDDPSQWLRAERLLPQFAELTGSLWAIHNLGKSLNGNLLSLPNTLDSGFAAEQTNNEDLPLCWLWQKLIRIIRELHPSIWLRFRGDFCRRRSLGFTAFSMEEGREICSSFLFFFYPKPTINIQK